jgi:serine/threonine protein kinase
LPQPGTLIEGKYEILGKIREGGMGSIYKVRHKLLDEIRVVKVMRPEMVGDEELRRRFAEEAKTATRLKHPHIGTIYDFALDDDGTAYLVMEFIEGANLAELMVSGHPPNLSLSLEIAHQALLALSYLHRKNIVHRDVAPDNLMLTHDEDGRPHVKLIDLGIAKAVDKEQRMTSTGVFLGKLKYASPELFGSLPPGEKIDGRSDLYSLGVVLYKLLTGVRPFAGDAPAELVRAHLFLPPTSFEQTDPEGRVPPEVQAVVLKALQKKREDRFASADEFDREIVALRRQYADPEDLEGTQAIVSRARHTRDSLAVTVTPSAQDRLDRQFIAQATPHPSRPTHTVDTIETKQFEKAVFEPRGAPPAAPVGSAPPRQHRMRAIAVAAPIALAVIVTAALLLRHRPGHETAPARAPTPGPVSTPFVQSQPTAAAEPTVAPTIAPAEAPASPPPTVSLMEEGLPRRAAEEARTRAARSRSAAERARAPELAADALASAAVKQREAQGHFERRNWAAAKAAFEHAATLFEGAQIRAEAARRETLRPSPVVVAAAAVPTARPEPTRALPVAVITAELQKPPPTAPPGEPARPAATEQDRIREAIRRYEKALSTLDADLYAGIYPSVDRDKIRANFQSLRSQALEFTIQRIEIAPGGASAAVRGYEKRTAAPRIGSEQRFNGERVIHLEKRGESWVIVSVS